MSFRNLCLARTVAVFAATSAAHADPTRKLKIGVDLYGLKAEFMQLWAASVKQSPEVKDGSVEVTVFEGATTRWCSRTSSTP